MFHRHKANILIINNYIFNYILPRYFSEIRFESLCLRVQVTKSAAALCKTTLLVGCSLRGRTRCPYSITYSDGMYFTLTQRQSTAVPASKSRMAVLKQLHP